MDHLSDMRLMELALDPASVPLNGEAKHLEQCAACAERLAGEQRLTELVNAIPRSAVPPGFTARAVARYRRKSAGRNLRSLPIGLAACALLMVSMLWIVIANSASLLGSIGSTLGGIAVLSRALIRVIIDAPVIGVALAAAFTTAAVILCGLLSTLIRRAAPVKYRGS